MLKPFVAIGAAIRKGTAMASDYLLFIDGIKGESNDSRHPHAIEIESFSFGASNPGSAGHGRGAGAGIVDLRDFRFRAQVSVATSELMIACLSGKAFRNAELFCRKQGETQQDYFVVRLKHFLISSYECTGSTGSDNLPIEEFAINYSEILFEYKPQREDGSLAAPITAGWNLKEKRRI
jgi:type VI secretion system secreted protein Hcp